MVGWLVWSAGIAQPLFAEVDRQWVGESARPAHAYETQELVVLGVHPERPWVAFRRSVKAAALEGEYSWPDCGYAGLEGETIGVQLGVFDLEQGHNLHGWWVYPPAVKAGECATHEVSGKRLAEAKATFAELGIDISEPPPPRSLASVGLVAKDSRATRLKPGEDFTELARRSLWRGTTELYVREYADFHPSYHTITFGAAYPVGARTFVVECVFDGVRYRGGRNLCTYTPPLPPP